MDEYELERFIARRYEERFGEPPMKVKSARYPSEIDIVIYVKGVTDEKQKFAREIYMYDLAKKQEMAICTHPSDQREVAIYGDRIVWTDSRNSLRK